MAELIREAATEASALGNLWHDQEWADSGDYAQHDVRKSAAALGETFPPCPHVSKHSVYGHRDGHEGYNHSYLQCDECGADFDPEAT